MGWSYDGGSNGSMGFGGPSSSGPSGTLAGSWGRSGYDPSTMGLTSQVANGTAGNNTQYTRDPRTGEIVQIGAPSLLGGMLTTARGWEQKPGQMGMIGLSDKAHSGHQGYYSNNQRNIKARAAARIASEKADLATLARQVAAGKISPFGRIQGVKALNKGNLPELEGYLGSPSAMRGTHHAGGMFGSMFGWGKGADDVQTMAETNKGLGKVDPDNPMGYSPLGLGFLTASPTVAQKLAGLTKSPVAGALGKKGMDFAAKQVGPTTPSGSTVASMGLGMLGVPVGGQFAQAVGLMNRAADLNYAGYTGSPNAPTQGYGEKENGNEEWWPKVV